MNTLKTVKGKLTLIAMVALPILTAMQANAQEQKAPAKTNIETIEVVGQKTLNYYRSAMESAEVAFYDEFNKHVKKSKYKVTCKDEPRDDSYRITQKACYPRYFLDKRTDMINKARQARVAIPTNKDVEAALKKEKDKALMHAEKLVQKHPELKAKLIEMYKSKQIFQRAEQLSKQ